MNNRRICRLCKFEKDIDQFYVNRKSGKDGYQTLCKECDRKKKRKWYEENKEQVLREAKAYNALIQSGITVDLQEKKERRRTLANKRRRGFLLKSFYQLSLQEFEDIFKSQGNKCAMCGTDDPKGARRQWMVDHDHSCCPGRKTCGKCVRGIVCAACNTGLGVYERVKTKAEVYLKAFEEKQAELEKVA